MYFYLYGVVSVIKLLLGNIGSGKTAMMVREMKQHPERHYISNIDTKGIPNNERIKRDMLIKEEVVSYKKNGEPIIKQSFNKEYWMKRHRKDPVHVVLDEAHTLFDSRRAMSKKNKIMSDFLALLRRFVGGVDGRQGSLTLITQLDRRIDVIAREMATQTAYCIDTYISSCFSCNYHIHQTNEEPNRLEYCPSCGRLLENSSHKIIVHYFKNATDYIYWKEYGRKIYYKRIMVNDIESVFGNYNTYQLSDLFDDE